MQTKHWYRNCGGASWIQDVARDWSAVTCVSCCESAVDAHKESPNQFLVGAVDRLRELTAQSPPARQWHVDAWLKGGCSVCGKADRGDGGLYCSDGKCGGLGAATTERDGMMLIDAIKDAGYGSCIDPRGNTPEPSKQEPPREHTVTVDVKNMDVVKEAIATRDILLTRCIAFLNDVGISEQRAMSTARNNERAQLVRDIKEAIVPADKKR